MSKSLNPASGACKCTQSGLLWAGGTFLVFFDCWKWLYTIKGTLKDVGRAQRGCCVSIRNLQIWPASLGSKVRWKAFQSIFLRSNRLQITADNDFSHEIKRCLLIWRKAMTNLYIKKKKQRHYFPEKVQYNQSYDFSSCHVWMWELDHKEWWVMKN